MTIFRLATIDVHSFRKPSPTISNNISELISILEPLKLDLIVVQEIQNNDKWKEFYQRLSLPFSAQGPPNRTFGNGIASRYSLNSNSIQQASFFCNGGVRSILRCCLDGIENLTVAVTHLDHLDEDDRLKQIKEFNPCQQNIDILMGDMNALTREDYTDDYYRHMVVENREKSYWEKPRFDLTQLITHEWNYQDAFKQINPTLKDKQVVTCRFGTRIDYIYIHPRVNDHWILTECSIIDTKGATDHNAVFAEFKQISK
jgi:endonuclease/exonuclease/phosphatase family metal-dependent hydrolase